MKKAIISILLAILLITALLPASALAAESGETIRVGWFPYPNSSEVHDGVYSGYTYDYLMEIAKYTDWEYEFIEADFASCCQMLAAGELDIIGGLEITEERERIYDFSELPFSQTYLVMFAGRDSVLEPFDYETYNGIHIGILKGSSNRESTAKFAEENGFTYELSEYDTNMDLESAVTAGEIDAGVLLSYTATDDTKIIAKFAPKSIRFVTTKGNSEILSGLNRAMTLIRINTIDFETKLYQKYYVEDVSVDLSKEELALVQASLETPVIVGVVDNCAPVNFWNNDTGAYEGITIDMLNAVSERTGLRIQYVTVDLSRSDSVATPNENSPMLVLGVPKAATIPDTRNWYMSDSLLSDSLAVVGLQGQNLSAEQGEKTVAVMANFAMASDYAKLYMPEYTLMECTTPQECLDAVAAGKANAAIYFHSSISYFLQKPCYDKLEIVPTYSESVDMCVAGFVPAAKSYISIIDKGLRMVPESESRSITLNYTVNNPYKLTLSDILYKFRTPMMAIACLVLFIIALLTALYVLKQKSNREVQVALAEARQASAAKGNFMSRMSHEIRTPLNAVIGYNTIAQNEMTEAKTDEERRQSEMKVMDCLTKSGIASKHLLTIINDVLDMSAIESGKIKVVKERFDFKGLISSLTAVFYSQAKSKGVDFNVQFDTQMDEWVVGDQMRVNQILTNLLSNAVKFTPDGGKVTLFIRPETDKDSIRLRFEVRDTGIGMPEAYLERIWQPFEQADSSISRRFGGTGLGLSITKTLVELQGGTISVESSVGEGSTFRVDLSFERTEQPKSAGLYDFSSVNTLIVDDDVSTCDYIRLLLTRSGVRSAAVNSGAEAIAAVEAALRAGEPYTVCLIDWRMPKMDGLETVKQIRNIVGETLPIIVITAYDFSEVADKAAEVGVNMFISKPLFQSSLFNLLANISGSPVPRDEEKFTSYDFSGSRVLLVEDNAMNMEIARKILEAAKLTVDGAWNGQEAVDMFLSSPAGKYKAILMDVQMPVMDGYQATQTIRASQHSEAASIPIIAMTADAFAENIAESRAAGMNDHISKPIDLPSLFKVLNSFIQ